MAKRILIAGILGGLVLFMWGGLAHMVLGLGEVGMQYLPQQQPVMDTLKASVPQSGFYFFPQADASNNMPPDKLGGPWGIMIYHSAGAGGPMTGQLIRECGLNIIMALFAAFLLSLAPGLTRYLRRVGFVTLIGLMVGMMTNLQYWNWYGFPSNYTLANLIENVIGFLLVGFIAAAFVKPSAGQVVTMPSKAA